MVHAASCRIDSQEFLVSRRGQCFHAKDPRHVASSRTELSFQSQPAENFQGAESEVPGPWIPGNIGPLLDQHRANPLLAQQEGRDKPRLLLTSRWLDLQLAGMRRTASPCSLEP